MLCRIRLLVPEPRTHRSLQQQIWVDLEKAIQLHLDSDLSPSTQQASPAVSLQHPTLFMILLSTDNCGTQAQEKRNTDRYLAVGGSELSTNYTISTTYSTSWNMRPAISAQGGYVYSILVPKTSTVQQRETARRNTTALTRLPAPASSQQPNTHGILNSNRHTERKHGR